MERVYWPGRRLLSVFVLVCLWLPPLLAEAATDLTVTVGQPGTTSTAMRLKLGICGAGAGSADCARFVGMLKHCLEWDDRFEVATDVMRELPTKKAEVTHLFDAGFDAAVFINFTSSDQPIEWRLYDTKPGEMVCGRRCASSGYLKEAAYAIAARIMRELMAQEPPFLTQIAFIERDRPHRRSLLCLTDFDGESCQVLFLSPRIMVAPTWGKDPKNPLILLSEFTPSNVRFVGVDMVGNKYTVMDLDGTSVGLSYSPLSEDVAYCRSGVIWGYHFDATTKKAEHRVLIDEGGLCAFPTLLGSGDIIYGSRGKIKLWDAAMQKAKVLVGEGYNVAPAYSGAQQKIVYSSRVRGTMQLFEYDMQTGKKRQLTCDRGNKVDPSWSPCGNYIAFCWELGRESRIAILNCERGGYRYVTPKTRSCAFPSWSPVFEGLAFSAVRPSVRPSDFEGHSR
ncbi:MAG: hypothetical protein M1549_00700 [Candidatus Dependentiae bacterium]|nr:hypothetical protein [Candidatus Dependentiae bacterium]